MSVSQPVQHSFEGGRISPLMEMRYDWPGREKSVRTMDNWICRLQGPAETRGGLRRIAGVPGSRGRIEEFHVNSFTSFIIIITTTSIFIADEGGLVSSGNLVSNGDFNEAGLDWTETAIGSAIVAFPGGWVYLEGGGAGQYARVCQGVTVVAGEAHELNIQIVRGEGPLEVMVGSAAGLSDVLAPTDFSGTADISIPGLTSTTTTMYICMSVNGAQPAKELTNVSLVNTVTPVPPVEFVSPYETITDLLQLQVAMPPKELSLYIVAPGVSPRRINYNKVTDEWAFEVVPFVSQPPEWGADNWPGVIAFFEGRAYYAGTANQPEDFWGSRPGSSGATPVEYYVDMTLGENPDDAIQHTIGKKGLIVWMEGADTLLAGTEVGEYVITSQEGLIIPGDIQVKQQSANGSSAVRASLAGNNVLYLSSSRERIHTMSFEWTKDAWLSKDLTFSQEGLLSDGNRIVHMGFANTPRHIVWGWLINGDILGATYDALSQTAGFHQHRSQDPVVGMTVRRFGGVDELWVIVDRDGTGNEISLEKFDPSVKMDGFLDFTFETPTDTVSGLEHLANRTCQVLLDGAVHPDVVVSAGGVATLQEKGTEVVIGLGFNSKLVTLPRDDSMSLGGLKSGSALPATKRWPKIWARISRSLKPLINGIRPPERTAAAPMNEIQPSETENVQVTLRGFDQDAVITIEQDLPVPTTLTGLFGHFDQESV